MKKLVILVDSTTLNDGALNDILTDRCGGFFVTKGRGYWQANGGLAVVKGDALAPSLEYTFIVKTQTEVKLICGYFSQYLHEHTQEECFLFYLSDVEAAEVYAAPTNGVRERLEACLSGDNLPVLATEILPDIIRNVNPGYRRQPIMNEGIVMRPGNIGYGGNAVKIKDTTPGREKSARKNHHSARFVN